MNFISQLSSDFRAWVKNGCVNFTFVMVMAAAVAGVGWLVRRRRPRPGPSLLERAEAQADSSERVLLGHYELLKSIGQGNMATVYQARDSRDGSILAIKVVRPEHRRDVEFRRRFVREVELAQSLKHANLVSVYDAVKLEDDLFLTMEFVDGLLLEECIARGPIEVARFRNWAVQMLAGLHFAHQRHLYHRDIKPSNIMVTKQEQVKIFDFGLAIEEGQDRFTHMGFSMGTPSHMAPEMLTLGVSDAKTDQYALGVVFYQMLTGRCPFEARNPMELGLKHVQEEPPPLRQFQPNLPTALESLVLRMLAKEPTGRFSDLAEIEALLRT